MQLTYTQKQEFYQTGFVKIPGVVPQVMIDDTVGLAYGCRKYTLTCGSDKLKHLIVRPNRPKHSRGESDELAKQSNAK